jgi:hypothetical protein
MAHVMDRYGIQAPAMDVGDPVPCNEEFRIFGFGECTDAFVGFGAFALVREKQLLPDALLAVFDNLLYEEARHIVFFINWWRYEEALAGRDKPFTRSFTSMGYHLRAAMGTAKGAAEMPPMPKLEDPELDAIVKSITPAQFLETALAENRRVMARLDPRLLKPTIMPVAATLLLAAIRMLPPRPDALRPAQGEKRRSQRDGEGEARAAA